MDSDWERLLIKHERDGNPLVVDAINLEASLCLSDQLVLEKDESESGTGDGECSSTLTIAQHNAVVKIYQKTIYQMIQDYEKQLKSKDQTIGKLRAEVEQLTASLEEADEVFNVDGVFVEDSCQDSVEEADGDVVIAEALKSSQSSSNSDVDDEMTHDPDNSKKNQYLVAIDIEPGSAVICDICEKSMSSKKVLKKHMRIVHATEKAFACDICDKRFCLNDALKRHIRIHTGEKPYVCPLCSKGFNQSGNLKVHERNCKAKAPRAKRKSRQLNAKKVQD